MYSIEYESQLFEKLINEAKSQVEHCPKPIYIQSQESLTFRKFGWSDEKLEEIASNIKFPRDVFNRRNAKTIIIQFFRFYFMGKINENNSLASTIFSAISLLNVPEVVNGKFTFKRVFEDQNEETDNYQPFYHWMGKYSSASLNYIETYADNFLIFEIIAILESWNENAIDINEDQAKLMRLTAFLALSLCRCIMRNPYLLMSVFNSREYRQYLCDFVGWSMEQTYWIPCSECIHRIYALIDNIAPIFAITVRQWIFTVKNNPKDELTKALLYTSLLEATMGYGIQAMNLLESVLKYTEKNFLELMEIICVIDPEITKFSDWQVLIHYYKNYCNSEKNMSFPWARLIDNSYLQECTLEESCFVGATLAAILEYKIGALCWRASWVRSNPNLTGRGIRLGRFVHEILMDTDPDIKTS